MMQDIFPSPWLTNTLLDDGFIEQQASALVAKPFAHGLEAWLQLHF